MTTNAVAGHIGGRPETVREAVMGALRDFARAYKRDPDEALASLDIYERVVRDFLPEAIATGAAAVLEEERFWPAPATLRKHVVEAHQRIVQSRSALVPVRYDGPSGMVCPTCGARATMRNTRLAIDHDPRAHGVYFRPGPT